MRLPGIIGKDNHKNFISNLTKDIISKKLSYYGGDNLFNNIFHIDTLVNLLKKLINKGIKKTFDIINIGSNNPIKINKVVELLDGKIVKNPMKDSKNMFTINIDKLNEYYNKKFTTKYFLKKYLNEIKFN